MDKEGDDDKVHVVGSLPKNSKGDIVGLIYDPLIDPNHFEFTLIDNDSLSNTVVYKSAKPQDFEKSEKIMKTHPKNVRFLNIVT